MLETIFFHPISSWDNDMYIVYVAWALIIVVSMWLIRFIHKSVRKNRMVYQGTEYSLDRDTFMCVNGFEYLLVCEVVLALYLGWWAYKVKPSTGQWDNWQTYLIVLPQIACVLTIIVMFIIRYTNFRKPYIK